MDVKSMVYEYKEELLSRLGKLISINSVEGTPEPDAPFGKGPKVALETALEMMKADGFDTVNLDNYIGYTEILTSFSSMFSILNSRFSLLK